jgi:N-methylhydantoinase B
MMQKFSRATVEASIEELMRQSDERARTRLREIPPGTYSAESFMDDDGVTLGKRIPIRVKVIVTAEKMIVDLSELSDQVQGFYNSSSATGRGCAQVAFKCLTSADDFPINDGSFRALEVVLPEGKVVSARRPAAMRYWMTIPMTIVDTIFKALAPVIPAKVIAGHHADLMLAQVTGAPDKTGRGFFHTAGMIGGGWGAKSGEDGVSATVCINDGDTHNGPIEQLEKKCPFLVEKYGLRTDSGGPGKFRGGLGTEFICTVLEPVTFSSSVERMHCSPWGIQGGGDAAGNSVAIRRANVEHVHVNGKIRGAKLERGDAFFLRSGGGGGFGCPNDRDREAVLEDLREGYVSADAAGMSYGMSAQPAGEKTEQV